MKNLSIKEDENMIYGFGIIGLGSIADTHAKAICKLNNGKLVACYSRSQSRAEQFAKKNNCRGYSSSKEFLNNPDLDIVTICTPSGCHLEPALEILESGKHIIIEKPLEITLDRCDKIINKYLQKNLKLGVIFQSRFNEAAQFVKKSLEEKKLGRLVLGDAYVKWYRSQEYYNSGGWHGKIKYEGGGVLMTQAIHAIDLQQWYMGKVHSVQAFANTIGHKNIEVEDNAVAVMQFENGALGVIEGTTAIHPGFLKRIEISGTKGSIILEEDYVKEYSILNEAEVSRKIIKKYGNKTNSAGGANDPKAINYTGHKNQFENFIEAVEKNKDPLVNGIEGRKSVEIILAIYESVKKGKLVKIK